MALNSASVKPKRLATCAKNSSSRGSQVVVGPGNMEQAVEHILEQLAVALEHGGELLSIGLIACHILLGEVEDARDVLHLAFRDLEHLPEGVHVVLGYDAVGFGHLGAERDDANSECELICSGGIRVVTVDSVMTGDAPEQGTDRAADRQACCRTRWLAPDRNCRNSCPRNSITKT